jgi:hypothetical protein
MSQNKEQKEERLHLPGRKAIIVLLVIALAIFWLVALIAGKTDFGCSPRHELVRPQPQDRVLPRSPAKSEVVRQADGTWLIKWTGEGENGFRLPDLEPGGYSLSWLRGQIVYSANGHSFPLWGADVYYKSNLRYFHLRDKGVRPHQVILVKGIIGSGKEELFPFQPRKTQIFFRFDGRPIYLFYHFTREEYDQFGWDGSYAVFQLKKKMNKIKPR